MAAVSLLPHGGLSNPNPVVRSPSLSSPNAEQQDAVVSEIFDLIRDIRDPEHPHTLEELSVVNEDCITVQHRHTPGDTTCSTRQQQPNPASQREENRSTQEKEDDEEEELWIKIEFTPTVPHCSLATLIGLCLRVKLERCLESRFKLDIVVSEGTHSIEEDVNKQINDKERVAAAMENPSLRDMVEECIKAAEY